MPTLSRRTLIAGGGLLTFLNVTQSAKLLGALTTDGASSSPRPVPAATGLRLGNWDEGRGRGNLAANSVVDSAMARAIGTTTSVSQIMHGYSSGSNSTWYTNFAKSPVSAAGTGFGKTALLNHGWNHDYAGVLAGKYDSAMAALAESIPTDVKLYVTPQHEPENDRGIDPTQWARSVARAVNVMAPIYRRRGLGGGIGGLLMGHWTLTGQSAYEKWNWVKYVAKANLPHAVYMIDDYAKFLTKTTTESLVPGWQRIFNYARADGVARFLVGEAGISIEKRNSGGQIIGNVAGQVAWIQREVALARKVAGLEAVIYFHKPTGPASAHDTLTGEALIAWARASVHR